MKINAARLEADINTLSEIGKTDNGITRQAFSKEEMQARKWLIGQMKDAGLSVTTDGAGNIRGRLEDAHNASQPAVATGSHIDTVKCGGHLDGALGVLAGVEALRCLKESGTPLSHPLEVIAFSDEEGRFGGMIGSRAIVGTLPESELKTATDVDGVKLYDCLVEHGFDPDQALSAKQNPDAFKAFIELHIEQGPVLEGAEKPIGVVEAITGLFKWEISIKGQANHAGTTPMDMRYDAFQGLVDFSIQIREILKNHGSPSTKATVGKVQLLPGSPNVVPGECVFTLEVRDIDQALLDELQGICRTALQQVAKENELEFDIRPLSDIKATPCDPDIVQAISAQAQAENIDMIVMPSGAAHDAQNMAKITKIGMIFVPSLNGVSHSSKEFTAMEDIEVGANVLLNSLHALAQ